MKLHYFVLIFVIFCGCKNGVSDRYQIRDIEESHPNLWLNNNLEVEAPRTKEPPSPPLPPLKKGSKIIKSGNIRLEVAHLGEAKSALDTLVKSVGGYYENEAFESQKYKSTFLSSSTMLLTIIDYILNLKVGFYF